MHSNSIFEVFLTTARRICSSRFVHHIDYKYSLKWTKREKKYQKGLKKDINMINYLRGFIYHTYIYTIFSFKCFSLNFKTQIQNV